MTKPLPIFSKWSMADKSFGRSMEKMKRSWNPHDPDWVSFKRNLTMFFLQQEFWEHHTHITVDNCWSGDAFSSKHNQCCKYEVAASEVTLSSVVACFPNPLAAAAVCLLTSTSMSVGRTWLGDSQGSNRRVCHQLLQALGSYEQLLATLPQENWDVD